MEANDLKILAIDDNRDNLMALRAVVSDRLPGFRILTALDGPKGLEIALAEDPVVILLDIVMPGMDGYAVCRELKRDERLRTIPVLFLTAIRSNPDSRIRALEAGAEGFLSKPLDETELVAQIRAMAKIKAANRLQRLEKEQLAALVAERTLELEQELTERKRAEAALKKEAHLTKVLLDAFPCPALLLRPRSHEIVASNRAAIEKGALPGATCFGTWGQREDSCPWCLAPALWETGSEQHLEVEALGVCWDAHWIPVADDLYMHFAFDITERKQAEQEREITIELLRLANMSRSKRELIQSAVTFFRERSGCEAVGVRLREGADYPYYEVQGFPAEFVELENHLCADGAGATDPSARNHTDQSALVCECMCGNVICGRFDPVKPFFTAQGSFWTNSTSRLLAGTTEADRQGRTRNRCNGEGYESVALFPLLAGEERLGLLQLNDSRPDRFTPQTIALWERLAGSLAVSLSKLLADEALRKSEAKFREMSAQFHALLDTIPDTIKLLSPDLKVLWANKVAVARLDRPEDVVGMHCYTFCQERAEPCEPCPAMQSFRSGKPALETVTSPDDRILELRTIPVVEEGRVVSVIEVGRDITEHKKLEMQYLHAQKMESIGTLAGGVAHDFNNILTVIVGLGKIMLMEMAEGDPQRGNIGGILEAAERATQLTKELLLFSRKKESERRPIDLNEVVGRMRKFLQRVIGEDIALKQVLHAAPLPVLADSSQLEQVLMNLGVNARDAMRQGGDFVLRTEQVFLREDAVAIHGGGKPGAYALLTVSDTGVGMDKETLQRIFEPFFTTKEVGKGTGLGLAVVYGVVKQHEGFITVYSEPGQGSTFRIYLPLTAEARQEIEAPQEQTIAGGKETILLAEDNDLVRKLLTSILTDAGYTVIAAVDGEEAVRRFRENAGSIQLLLFDLIMPKMNGKEASDEIQGMQPGIKTIFASGYAPDIAQQKASPDEGSYLIYKPVSPQELLRKVRNVLDGTL